MKTNHKTNKRTIKALILIGVIIVAAVHVSTLQAASPVVDSGNGTIMKGFTPGAHVGYAVQSAAGVLTSGSGKIDSNGRFTLPPLGKIRYESLPVNYTIQIDAGGQDPLAVKFTLKADKELVAVKATGLDKFSTIEMRTPTQGLQQSRSDWAGIFQKSDAARLEDVVADEGFEVAFLDGRMNDGLPETQPRIIRIQTGSFECGGTQPQLSICDTSQLEMRRADIKKYVTQSLQGATAQLTSAMTQSVSILGEFLDAKMQLEGQQLFQRLTAQAHKDYQPSEQMCEFGSFMRSLPKAEEKSGLQKAALNEGLMREYTGTATASSGPGATNDFDARLDKFRRVYCNAGDDNGTLGNGLCLKTPDAAATDVRKNRDIDYTRLVYAPLTINANVSSEKPGAEKATQEDLIALSRNLYWPKAFDPVASGDLNQKFPQYMNARKVFAMTNVAHNTLANIIGMKSQSSPNETGPGGADFMKSLLKELGLSPADIQTMMGENPSYYAQMEVLTKKIYQSPDFYTNLYDKPANVDRIGVSLDAVALMQGRDQYESALRREMLTSMMVEQALTLRPQGDEARNQGQGSPYEAVNSKLRAGTR